MSVRQVVAGVTLVAASATAGYYVTGEVREALGGDHPASERAAEIHNCAAALGELATGPVAIEACDDFIREGIELKTEYFKDGKMSTSEIERDLTYVLDKKNDINEKNDKAAGALALATTAILAMFGWRAVRRRMDEIDQFISETEGATDRREERLAAIEAKGDANIQRLEAEVQRLDSHTDEIERESDK